jgi:hypothetical protein
MQFDSLIKEELVLHIVKLCPGCGVVTLKLDGCNYLKCPMCQCEWCWLCEKRKYQECNDRDHNSH